MRLGLPFIVPAATGAGNIVNLSGLFYIVRAAQGVNLPVTSPARSETHGSLYELPDPAGFMFSN